MTVTAWPAMTMREARAAMADKKADRHWSPVECWCGEVHGPETPGLAPPPWPVETGEGS